MVESGLGEARKKKAMDWKPELPLKEAAKFVALCPDYTKKKLRLQ